MKTVEELANLIVVRNHLSDLLNGTRNAVKKGEIGSLSALIQKLDVEIIQSSLAVFSDVAVSATDDIDIAKKVAEAKEKMLLAKNTKLASPLLTAKALTAACEVPVEQPAEVSKKPTKKAFKRVSKDEPSST